MNGSGPVEILANLSTGAIHAQCPEVIDTDGRLVKVEIVIAGDDLIHLAAALNLLMPDMDTTD